jgi:hypothetical protein
MFLRKSKNMRNTYIKNNFKWYRLESVKNIFFEQHVCCDNSFALSCDILSGLLT